MEETKKKKKKVPNRKVKLSDGTVIQATDNSAGSVRNGGTGKHVIPKKPFSTETGIPYESYTVTDDYDKHAYPPPSKHPEFRKFWMEIIDNLISRDNFQPAHLRLLEVYCRLCVELRRLDDFIMQNGHTFRIITVTGEIRKTYPEVAERHRIISAVERYAKLLDLKPAKDKTKGAGYTEEADEWL